MYYICKLGTTVTPMVKLVIVIVVGLITDHDPSIKWLRKGNR